MCRYGDPQTRTVIIPGIRNGSIPSPLVLPRRFRTRGARAELQNVISEVVIRRLDDFGVILEQPDPHVAGTAQQSPNVSVPVVMINDWLGCSRGTIFIFMVDEGIIQSNRANRTGVPLSLQHFNESFMRQLISPLDPILAPLSL